MNTPYKVNAAGQKIEVPSKVTGVGNTTLGDSAFTAITAPGNCKKILVKMRTDVAWKLAAASAGTTYLSVGGTTMLELDFAAVSGATLFYAEAASGTPVLEVVALD